MSELSNSITELGNLLLKEKQVDCPVVHSFGPGVYIRQVTVPAGTFTIGHHQNEKHMNIFLKGKVTILKEDGSTQELKAPMTFVGEPGRKVGFVQEDMTWLNVYSTNETDIEKLEQRFLTKSVEFTENQKLGQGLMRLSCELDRKDYDLLISDLGMSEEQVKKQVESLEDQAELPAGNYKFKKGDSAIHGKGVFATSTIEAGEVIGPARISEKRTILGRFVNHSVNPNAKMILDESGDVFLVAISQIEGCKGGQDGQEIVTNYRDTFKEVFGGENVSSNGRSFNSWSNNWGHSSK